MEYVCGHCGYRGECPTDMTSGGVDAPRCSRCFKSDKLTLIDPDAVEDRSHGVRRPDWRDMIERAGGWHATIPAEAIRPLIEEIEELREHNYGLRLQIEAIGDDETAAYVRKWIEAFRHDPSVPGILLMCQEALEWKREAASARRIADEAMSHYDAEGLMGALTENLGKALGIDMDNEDDLLRRQKMHGDIKIAVNLLGKFMEITDSFKPKNCDEFCGCLFCRTKKFISELPAFLRAEYLGKYDEKEGEEDDD